MKLAFSTNAFKRFSLEDSIRQIAKTGYTGVEILCDVPHAYPPTMGDEQIRRISKLIAASGLQISNLNSFTLYAVRDVYHPSWIERDEDGRAVRLEHTINCLRLARKLGAECISTEPGGPVEGSGDRENLVRIFAEGVRKAAVAAEEEGVKLLVEPEPFLLLERSREFVDFMRGIDSDYVGLNFDIGHFYCVGEDPSELVRELADYIGHFHLADIAKTRVHNHLVPGRGSIDIQRVFDAIDSIGYGGFVTVELYPYQDNPVQVAQEAFQYCKGLKASRLE